MGFFRKEKKELISTEKTAEYIKQMTEKEMYFLEFAEGCTSLYESKLGGVPYWKSDMPYPADKDGNYMSLLLQIKFENDEVFENGILQFFISNDNRGGLNYENPEDQSGFKIVFHKTVDESITENDVLKIGMPTMPMDDDTFSPVKKEAKVILKKGKDFIKASDYNFNTCFKKAVFELSGKDIKDAVPQDYFSEDELKKFYSYFEEGKSKLFGYPSFIQEDSRIFTKNAEYYDTLLLQIDSDLENGIVMWGDSGQANFILNGEKIKELDFSQALYNWDCF